MTIRTIDADTPTNFTVSNPDFGYTTTINLNTRLQRLSNNNYSIWDNGAAFDSRMCKCNWFLSLAETNTLIDTFTDDNGIGTISKARAVNVELTPDAGFFPFGPDKGDAVTFTARLVGITPREIHGHPNDFFNTECVFVHNGSFPAFTPAAQIDEGDLQIGTITQLRWPMTNHKADIEYAVNTVQTEDGTPHSNDMTSTADRFNARLPLTLREGNAAALLAHLQGTVRANNVNVIPPANAYMFGRENSDTATYSCKMLNQSIEVTHENHDRFVFDLNLYRESQT